ncbi:MAG: thrombospondin type 3 repeat-containing protein, partial [Deltaproteobacteria bacterium]|nr:thrombospondin type 3 repeat-containing protein [Nannocystaceae bacterium]
IFNNLLEPSYVEVIRTRPDNPNLFETYDWKTQILAVSGPIARYNGDWRDGGATGADRMTRFVSLSCAEERRKAGEAYDPARCNDVRASRAGEPVQTWKMQYVEGFDASDLSHRHAQATKSLLATRGKWDHRAIGEAAAIDCDTPEDGPDTCCSQCDWSLAVAVNKYGAGPRIPCDPLGDRLIDCAGFETDVARDDENRCEPGDTKCAPFELGRADVLRETHPAQRTGELDERVQHACRSNSECRDPARLGLAGAECIGTNADTRPCALDAGDPSCTAGTCRAPWFVECAADPDTTGAAGYCVDARHDADAAGACFEGTAVPGCSGSEPCRLSVCDEDADGNLTAAECCADGELCDPVYDGAVVERPRYDRKETLPGLVRGLDCGDWFNAPATAENNLRCDPERHVCDATPPTKAPPYDLEYCDKGDDGRCRTCRVRPDGDDNRFTTECRDCPKGDGECRSCEDDVAILCAAQGDLAANCNSSENAGDWAISFVTRLGGVIYDPALKGIEWRPADLGGRPRAVVEACAEERGLIDARSIADGWRAHDADGIAIEHESEFDIGMCSGQRYTVTFQNRQELDENGDLVAAEYVRDKAGNTLEGKNEYVFETPAFRVVPASGFPADALRIGACDSFSLSFSNKYDLSPENLDKIQLRDVTEALADVADASLLPIDLQAPVVAGGTGCAPDREAQAATGAAPCMIVDVTDQFRGVLHARIDPIMFGSVLEAGRTYELFVPGLDTVPAGMSDADARAQAFWDVCGMPVEHLDLEERVEYRYLFTVDPERCDEDEDGDSVQLSCDNAPDVYNPEQPDADFDGVGDAVDLCPASPELASETGDSDRDGIGNGCDNCGRAVARYNEQAVSLALASGLFVRNIPSQADSDRDGIGDACDNCPAVANCESYGESRPWRLGEPIEVDAGNCQFDAELDMVGDVCAGVQSELAAGPVGLGDYDDFDQDGLVNQFDGCPRQPELDMVPCTESSDCPASRACTKAPGTDEGVCDHQDVDDDGLGDICDTCPGEPNAMQTMDGGMQEDDTDGDFIGNACELADECQVTTGPRPIGFYAVASGGACCTTALVVDGDRLRERLTERLLVDAEGRPVQLSCASDACSLFPLELAEQPGVLAPPSGCDGALEQAGISLDGNHPLDTRDTQGDLDALWRTQCRMPALDQDYDGLGDGCDLCPYAFDPANTPYQDATGKLWPNDGAACSGANASGDSCDSPGDDDGGAADDGVDASSSSDGA